MKHRIRHLHFIGIGGSGMNGIAEVMHNLGYTVSGSDLHLSYTTEHLQQIGIQVFEGHNASHVQGVDAMVISSAVKADNPEVLEARKRNVPVVPRALMLAELMRLKRGIAIAGTHGKTTTTSLVASILAEGGLDPTFVIGGVLNSAGVNAQLGAGEYIVVEADESDASFLNLPPVMEVITNIDRDHMDTYGHDFGRLKSAFIEFTHRMPFYGAAIVCMDDANIREIIPFISRPVISYGLHAEADIQAVEIVPKGATMCFTVLRKRTDMSTTQLSVCLNLPGNHNVQNALAAIAVATELGISDEAIVSALAKFSGVGRRFTRHGPFPIRHRPGSFLLVDDYGHHPAEMKATILAARGAYPGKRLVLAFQPHRYTRTRDCFEDFVEVLNMADVLALEDVYAAGEEPIVAADSRALLRAVRVKGRIEPHYTPSHEELMQWLSETLEADDILLVMGAGNISQVIRQVIAEYGSAT